MKQANPAQSIETRMARHGMAWHAHGACCPDQPKKVEEKKDEKKTHFFSSHLDGMKRRLGSGAADSGITSTSRVNQSNSGS